MYIHNHQSKPLVDNSWLTSLVTSTSAPNGNMFLRVEKNPTIYPGNQSKMLP